MKKNVILFICGLFSVISLLYGQEPEKKQHLIIVNKQDTLISHAKEYFSKVDQEEIISITTIDDSAKVNQKTDIENISAIIYIELKEKDNK